MSKTMNKLMKVLPALLLAVIVAMIVMIIPAFAAGDDNAADVTTTSASQTVEEEAAAPDNTDAAIAMGNAVAKSAEGISRQPEAEGKIRTTLMLGLVFIETAIIYALLCVILIIFVL